MQNQSSIVSKLINYLSWTQDRGLTTPLSVREIIQQFSPQVFTAIFVVDTENLSSLEHTLFEKIVAAMKFPEGAYKVLSPKDFPAGEDLTTKYLAQIFIAMGPQAGASVAGRPVFLDHDAGLIQQSAVTGVNFIVTLHPREMFRNPALKPQCWDHLKKALAYLANHDRRSSAVQ